MISIVMPLFNKEKWVSECIQSIINQSFTNFELIIVNDGSTDSGLSIIQPFLDDRRISLINQQNAGVSAARNVGIRKAQYNYIAFIDADDLWHPDYLAICNIIIQQHPNIDIFSSDYILMKEERGMQWEKVKNVDFYKINNYFRYAHKETLFWTSATIVKKEVLNSTNLFNVELKTGEDLDLWFRIMIKGKGIRINHKLACYRLTEDDQGNPFKLPDINNHLVSKILNDDYFYVKKIKTTPFLRQFMYKYALNYLFLYYFASEQYREAWKIYRSIPLKYKLSRVRYFLYWLPRKIGRKIFLYIFYTRNKYNVNQEKVKREIYS